MDKAVPLIVRLYEIVDELEQMFPGRRFTPDGHMVGSIGEAWAKWLFDLELLPGSTAKHDAKAKDGKLVQIKATQGNGVAIYDEPDHLIVLKLLRTGKSEVVYNGPGAIPWRQAGAKGKNGQRPIGLAKLRSLDREVADDVRIPRVRDLLAGGK
jgi:hypothetical protein